MHRLLALVLTALIALPAQTLLAAGAASSTVAGTTGQISGHAFDFSGRQLARATVRLRNLATGLTLAGAPSGAAGDFSFSGLRAGNYVVEVGERGWPGDRNQPGHPVDARADDRDGYRSDRVAGSRGGRHRPGPRCYYWEVVLHVHAGHDHRGLAPASRLASTRRPSKTRARRDNDRSQRGSIEAAYPDNNVAQVLSDRRSAGL